MSLPSIQLCGRYWIWNRQPLPVSYSVLHARERGIEMACCSQLTGGFDNLVQYSLAFRGVLYFQDCSRYFAGLVFVEAKARLRQPTSPSVKYPSEVYLSLAITGHTRTITVGANIPQSRRFCVARPVWNQKGEQMLTLMTKNGRAFVRQAMKI